MGMLDLIVIVKIHCYVQARTSYKFSKSSTMYHRLKIEIVPEMGQVSLIHDTISRD